MSEKQILEEQLVNQFEKNFKNDCVEHCAGGDGKGYAVPDEDGDMYEIDSRNGDMWNSKERWYKDRWYIGSGVETRSKNGIWYSEVFHKRSDGSVKPEHFFMSAKGHKHMNEIIRNCILCEGNHLEMDCPNSCPCGYCHLPKDHVCTICKKVGYDHLEKDCPEK